MRTPRLLVLLPVAVVLACTDPIPVDTLGDPATNVPPAAGVIRGSVLYQGPRPCSTGGHIVGAAVVLLFDQNSPPPPNGLANTAVNFTQIPGDVLFANEPRWTGSDTYCPAKRGFEENITASAPFAVSPLAPAAYIIEAFYDTTGDFLPTFKFRNLPEQGDVGGGDIDTADALKAVNAGNPDYQPIFLPVGVGIPQPIPAGSPPGTVPLYSMPSQGFLADNVQVSIGEVLTTTRPYVYAQGIPTVPDTIDWNKGTDTANPQVVGQSSDQAYVPGVNAGIAGSLEIGNASNFPYAPVLTMPDDILTFGPPQNPLAALQTGADLFEFGGTNVLGHTAIGFPHLRLNYGVGAASLAVATSDPFDMQIQTFTASAPQLGGIQQWADAFIPPGGSSYIPRQVPEGGLFPNIWPSVILSKLVDDPTHTKDPASLQAQGSATEPVVIIEGLTLSGGTPPTVSSATTDADSVFKTLSAYVLSGGKGYWNPDGSPIVLTEDHVTTMLRPAAICFDSLFDSSTSDKRGVIVAPYLVNDSADTNAAGDPIVPNTPLVPIDLLANVPNPKDQGMVGPYGRVQITSLVKPPPGYQPPVVGDGGAIIGGTPPAIIGCLPTGRYAINVVYPDGQAWTVPNEAGACTGTATGEGSTNWNATPISCSIQPRPVIRSQGPRAVVEVVASNSAYCKAHPVPSQCLPHK